MNRIIFIIMLAGLTQCTDNDFDVNAFRDEASITSLNGTWKVVSLEKFREEEVIMPDKENLWNRDIIVTFNDTQSPAVLSGINATNSIFGEFEYTSSRQFKLFGLGSTFAGQPWLADEFSNALLDGNVDFKINHHRLRIYYAGRSRSITLEKQ